MLPRTRYRSEAAQLWETGCAERGMDRRLLTLGACNGVFGYAPLAGAAPASDY